MQENRRTTKSMIDKTSDLNDRHFLTGTLYKDCYYLLHSYSIEHGADYKTRLRLSVYLCIRLCPLSRSHFLIDFHQNWHRRKNPQK